MPWLYIIKGFKHLYLFINLQHQFTNRFAGFAHGEQELIDVFFSIGTNLKTLNMIRLREIIVAILMIKPTLLSVMIPILNVCIN